MNFCADCGHPPHPLNCDTTTETLWGPEPCACPIYTKDTDE